MSTFVIKKEKQGQPVELHGCNRAHVGIVEYLYLFESATGERMLHVQEAAEFGWSLLEGKRCHSYTVTTECKEQ